MYHKKWKESSSCTNANLTKATEKKPVPGSFYGFRYSHGSVTACHMFSCSEIYLDIYIYYIATTYIYSISHPIYQKVTSKWYLSQTFRANGIYCKSLGNTIIVDCRGGGSRDTNCIVLVFISVYSEFILFISFFVTFFVPVISKRFTMSNLLILSKQYFLHS